MMSRPCSFMFNKMKYQRYKLFQGVDRVNDGYGSSMYIQRIWHNYCVHTRIYRKLLS